MAKFYAWSPIEYDAEVHGEPPHPIVKKSVVKMGEEVTQAKIKATDEDWANLLETGAVRQRKLPENMRPGESPQTAIMRQANEMMAEASSGNVDVPPPVHEEVELASPTSKISVK